MLKIQNGTPNSGDNLCKSCRSCLRVKGANLQELFLCRKTTPERVVGFPVVDCSGYNDSRLPSIYDMQEIAWSIESRSRGRMGFTEGAPLLDVHILPPKKREEED